jgi:DHA3 family macrolide efflux protein-like MFS transporter
VKLTAAPLPLFSRNFALLWQGQLISHLGNQAFLIGTTIYLLKGTGSATLVALTMMAGTIPLVVVGPIGGTVADRYSRRGLLLFTDLLRAASTGALAGLVVWRPDVTTLHVGAIVAVATFNGVMSALFLPAFQALIPDLVASERLAAANAVNQMSTQAATLTGQAIGGILYVAAGPAVLLCLDAVSFAYAAAATSLLPEDRRVLRGSTRLRLVIHGYLEDTRAGLTYVWRHRGMAAVLGIFAGVNCLFMPVFVLLPFYTSEVLGAGPAWYGLLLSGAGAGALGGSVTAGVLVRKYQARAGLVRVCLGGIAAAVLLLAATDVTWTALAAFAAVGALASIINVTVVTAFQVAAPTEVRGRVMALVIAISTAAVPGGMALGGVLGDMWPGSLPAVFGGTGAAIAALAIVSRASKGLAGFFSTAPAEDGGTQHPALRTRH